MLSNTLNTNEVKNRAGAEVEFSRLSTSDRTTEYSQISETPSLPHRLKIAHQETGLGLKQRRRSVVRIDKTVMSGVDATLPVTVSAYIVLDAPIGALNTNTDMADALAELTSFVATLGASTILYDGTGHGANALLTGGL